jgi:hypothetical protein
MTKFDRLFVASSLAVATAALVLSLRTPSSQQQAFAGSLYANDLGPADALLLNTEAGKDPLRIGTKNNHIAWGDRATNRVWSVATVDIDKVMRKLLEGKSYVEKRNEIKDKLEKGEAGFQKRAEEIQAKYPIPQGGQPPAEGQQAFQALQQEYRVFRESIAGETEKMAAEQFEAAYRELTAAVDTVSEKEQIDLVFRFQPTAEPFEAKSSADAIDRIRARCFLRYPAEIDITAEVMKALNL